MVTNIQHICWEAESSPRALAESKAVGSNPGSPPRGFVNLPEPRLPLFSLCPQQGPEPSFYCGRGGGRKIFVFRREEGCTQGRKPGAASIYQAITMLLALSSIQLLQELCVTSGKPLSLKAPRGEVFLPGGYRMETRGPFRTREMT